MDRVSFLTAFNNQIDNFLNDLVNAFPKESEFAMLRDGILMVKKTNPRIIHNQFYDMIIPYKTQILSRDNDFFLIKDYKDDFNNVSVEYVSKITKKLKSLWCNSMTDDEKDKVWQYFESLITLGELACNKTVK